MATTLTGRLVKFNTKYEFHLTSSNLDGYISPHGNAIFKTIANSFDSKFVYNLMPGP